MDDETIRQQEARSVAIEAAAYRLLREKGFAATSMLAIATAARASNETLYRWYGNKQGLFAAMVARNAATVNEQLVRGLAGMDAGKALRRLGPRLLAMVTGEQAVLLNRVAAADAGRSTELGEALGRAGREAVLPLVANLIGAASRAGALKVSDPREAATVYLDLLLGDLPLRRVTGALASLDEAAIRRRANRAWRLLAHLYRNEGGSR